MNRGAERATGRILLFLHADTDLPNGAFTMIRRAMADESAAAGAFDLSIRSPRTAFRVIERVSSRRSRITRIPYGDQAIFLRSPYFREIGGYREIPLMEDVELMRRIKRRGDRIVFLEARVSTSAHLEKGGILRSPSGLALSPLPAWACPPAPRPYYPRRHEDALSFHTPGFFRLRQSGGKRGPSSGTTGVLRDARRQPRAWGHEHHGNT